MTAPAPDAEYVCVEPASIVIAPGARLRGDHPAVLGHPSRFVLADALSDDDLARIHRADARGRAERAFETAARLRRFGESGAMTPRRHRMTGEGS